jgi:8-oxo-dGTP diphosphatase
VSEPVRAAGGLVLRPGPELLVVHRPRYDDWTLPKGKLEPGESDEEGALREVEEETGLACDLGPEVAVVEYEDGEGRPKRVRYFAMRPPASEAVARNEVDEVRWLGPAEARRTLTYDRDREVVAGYFACGSSL